MGSTQEFHCKKKNFSRRPRTEILIMTDIKSSKDLVNDHDLLGEKPIDSSRVVELTDAEKAIEKRLVKRIDWLIMPLILTVYLSN